MTLERRALGRHDDHAAAEPAARRRFVAALSDSERVPPSPRRPLLGLAIAFALGLAIAPALPSTAWWHAAAATGGLLLLAAILRRSPAGALLIFASALICGALHGELSRPGAAPCDLVNVMTRDAEYFRISGRIADAPRLITTAREPEWRFTVEVEAVNRLADQWQRARGRCAVRLAAGGPTEPLYGDLIAVSGAVERRRDRREILRMNAAPATYRRLAGGGAPWRRTALEFRSAAARRLGEGIQSHFPRETAIVAALTLGLREDLPAETRNDFLLTGTMHIFAISGLHVGIVAAFAVGLLRAIGVPRRWLVVGLTPVLMLYVTATGLAASAIRAAVMAAAYAAASWFGRRPDVRSAFALAALAILAADAGQIRDVGFLYSFVIVAGLLFWAPTLEAPIRRRLAGEPWSSAPPSRWIRWGRATARAIALTAALSLTAWLASAPLQARFANRFAPAALVGNLLAVPAAFLIVLTGALSLLIGIVSTTGVEIFNHANRVIAGALADAMSALARAPGAHWNVASPSIAAVIGMYAALTGLFSLRGRPRRALAGAAAAVIAAAAAHRLFDRRVTVHAMSDALGSAALIEGPRVATVLIDAGPRRRAGALAAYLRSQGVNRIEALILTRADADSAGAAPELARHFAITRVFYPAAASARSPVFATALEQLRSSGIPVEPLARGDRRTLKDGAELDVFHPDNDAKYPNAAEGALVARWGRGGAAVLIGLPGTATAPLAALADSPTDSTAPLAVVDLRRTGGRIGPEAARWDEERERHLVAHSRPTAVIFQGPRTETAEAARLSNRMLARFDANRAFAVRLVLGGPPGADEGTGRISAVGWADSE